MAAVSVAERSGELREKAELLDLVLEATHDGVVEWDLVNDAATYNPRWQYLFGFDETEITSPTMWRELVHPDDLPRLSQALRDHLEQDWPFVFVMRMRHRSGGYRQFLCRGACRRDESGAAVRMVMCFSDIDDQVRVRERERALASAVPDTLLRLRRDGLVLGHKQGVDRELSPFAKVREGAKLSDCLERHVADPFERAAATMWSQGTPVTHAFEVRTQNPPMQHEVRLVPTCDDECVCIVRDVTERHELEQRLLQSQKMQAIGHLAAGVAHEINTPLQFIGDNLHFTADSIAAFLVLADRLKQMLVRETGERLAREIEDAEADADFEYMRARVPGAIDRSLQGVERVTKIVRALKQFAHPGSVEFAPADVNSIVENAVIMATNEWKYVADVELELSEALPRVVCDAGEISQAVLNVVVNAAHAIEAVGGSEKGKIRIETACDRSHAEIRISDTGTGIPEHARAKIFLPFFTTKAAGKGTGQGLAIAHATFVERHKGTLDFTTELGRGTTFILRIPLSP
jgi:PAS domain S-box-containing protein